VKPLFTPEIQEAEKYFQAAKEMGIDLNQAFRSAGIEIPSVTVNADNLYSQVYLKVLADRASEADKNLFDSIRLTLIRVVTETTNRDV